ncbi:MAG: glucan biosynthesis protein [Ignavibacteria bacterium]
MNRRELLKAATALGAAGMASPLRAQAGPVNVATMGFDYAWLKGQARALASQPWQAPAERLPEAVGRLDWDQWQSIRFRPSRALWARERLRFRVEFFHPGLNYRSPVGVHEVVGGRAREIAWDPAMFDYAANGIAPPRGEGLGFAGLRLHFHTDWRRDVAAFLGASYFRAVGAEMQYGLSARGLAVDCGTARPEEFPAFRAFWLERPAPEDDRLVVHALLDSPSVTGAYRFVIVPGAQLAMEVDAALYPRRRLDHLGVAPLTSMFLCGPADRRVADDWRPQIHDSDGLALWTGAGERVWRPLANPAQARSGVFIDENPRGFGLLQRDREFDHYQDDGAFYERRPSLWVEPRGDWGRGSVQLLELPAADETVDNVVACWVPAVAAQPGEEKLFACRLRWGAQPAPPGGLAQAVATRSGIGGVVGRPRRQFSWRFVVDFAGGPLGMLGRDAKVEPVIEATHGRIGIASARPLAPIGGVRAMFDLVPEEGDERPVDLRLYLRADGQALSETWLYQWTPPQRRTRP